MRLALAFFAGAPTARIRSLAKRWLGFVYRMEGNSVEALEVTSTTCVRAPKPKGVDVSRKRVMEPDSLSYIPIERVADLPAVCVSLTPNSPQGNFEVFTRAFAEHYISFEPRGVDWETAVNAQRAKITSQTTPAFGNH